MKAYIFIGFVLFFTQAYAVEVSDLDIGRGDKYTGEVKDGIPNGRGKAVGLDGFTYEGDWVDGKPHGYGEEAGAGRETYTGEWRNGVKHGEATVIWPDGFKFEGTFVDGKPDGIGVCTDKGVRKECRYESGDWVYLPNKNGNENIDIEKSTADLKAATGEETWKGLWDKYLSKKSPNPRTTYEQTDRLIRITEDDEDAFIFFTRETHPAHPSFAKIYLRTVDGKLKLSTVGFTWGDRKSYEEFMQTEILEYSKAVARQIRSSLADDSN